MKNQCLTLVVGTAYYKHLHCWCCYHILYHCVPWALCTFNAHCSVVVTVACVCVVSWLVHVAAIHWSGSTWRAHLTGCSLSSAVIQVRDSAAVTAGKWSLPSSRLSHTHGPRSLLLHSLSLSGIAVGVVLFVLLLLALAILAAYLIYAFVTHGTDSKRAKSHAPFGNGWAIVATQ